ncbi:tetratricopeptide repeat protein [Winogradskyella sp. DF17]|uniref:Tetratricopeptide repeat protein n=1 Tax=Winogradskyella pelagia TaxID=2819984 RepID=A0ABS3T4R0_9FLAO|nr:sensor histidine kinase [Winogradskyella sp. DF17]MBO3117726.1 tetratricopeptide repeat protein [Winogradskyella sp. DF17]
MRKLLLLLSLFCLTQVSSQQHIIDSLKVVIRNTPSDSIKIRAYSDLCWYYRTVSQDSAFFYGNKALSLSKEKNNVKGEAQALNDLGILYYSKAQYNKALQFYFKSLKIRQTTPDSLGMASLYNKIGLVHQNTYRLDSALVYALKALSIYESNGIERNAFILKNNIANIYKNLKQYDKALATHKEIAQYNFAINDQLALVKSYNNIANAYILLADTTNAENYYSKSLKIARNKGFSKELAALYNNIGGIYMNRKKYLAAIDNYQKSLNIRRELNDNFGEGSTLLNLGSLYLETKQIGKVEPYLRESLALARASQANEQIMNAYDKLSIYFAYKDLPDSTKYYNALYKQFNDSLFNEKVVKQVADVQEKYNAVAREKEIITQRAEIAEKELDISKKNLYVLGLGGMVFIVTLLGLLFYNRQKLKTEQIKKESELKEALVRIETQNKLQDQRLRISRDLHDNIGAQLTFIISTLDNLKFGFKLPEKLNDKLQGVSEFTTSTIYELRDTIWAMNKNKISFEDLQVRISNFIEKANIAAQGIQFNFNVDKNVDTDASFNSVKGMNIYRIIQEAINNAIKYAEPKTITVNVSAEASQLCFTISDDGKGFNVDEEERGNGLHNMQKRANEIDGKLNIIAQIGKGTKITLNC